MSRRDMIQSGREEAIVDAKYGRGVFGGYPPRRGAVGCSVAYYVDTAEGREWFQSYDYEPAKARAVALRTVLGTQEVW